MERLICSHDWKHNFCIRCGLNLCAKDKRLSKAQLSILQALQESAEPVNAKDIKANTLAALVRRNFLSVTLNTQEG